MTELILECQLCVLYLQAGNSDKHWLKPIKFTHRKQFIHIQLPVPMI